MIGSTQTVNISLVAGQADHGGKAGAILGADIVGGENPFTSPNYAVFVLSHNDLTGDKGNDTLIGGVQTLKISAVAGKADHGGDASASVAGSGFLFGDSTLTGGDDNDLLIGNVQNLEISAKGGKADGEGTTAGAGLVGNVIGNGGGRYVSNPGNNLNGGAGNDKLVGSFQTLKISLEGGKAMDGGFAAAVFATNLFALGGNILDGGDGNDVLIGDIENLVVSIKDGLVVSGNGDASAQMVGNIMGFAGNTLIGGAGNDILYANLVDMSQLLALDPEAFMVEGSENILRGGTGNDTLYGGVGINWADYSDANAGVTVNLSLAGPQAIGGGLGMDTLFNMNAIIGSQHSDTLTGNAQNNFFRGGDGNDKINGMGGWDVVSFKDITHATDNSAHGGGIFDVPDVLRDTYHDLQNAYGHPSWLPEAPLPADTILINGVWIGPAAFTGPAAIAHGTDVTTVQNIEGYEGTWAFSNYIAVNEYYLAHPDATAAEAGFNNPALLAGASSVDDVNARTTAENVLVGGSGNDVLLGGRSSFNFITGGAGDDLIQCGLDLQQGLVTAGASADYPFGTVAEATARSVNPNFCLTYAGEGDDTVYCYCSAEGLCLAYLGAGNDTYNDFCPKCVIVAYGGDGNDIFNVDCSINLKHLYGEAGDDTIYIKFNYANDIVEGGDGNDQLLNWASFGVAGRAVNGHFTGGAGNDTFGISMTHDVDGFLAVNGGASVGSLTITDFHISGEIDVLEFLAPGETALSINNAAAFSHSNVGGGAANDTVMTFHDGSTITLLDVTINALPINTVVVDVPQ